MSLTVPLRRRGRCRGGEECPSGDQQKGKDSSQLDTSDPTDQTPLGEHDPGAPDFSDHHDDNSLVACPAGDLQEMHAWVAESEKAIRPLLDTEEEREPFEIKRCGDRVTGAFDGTAAKQTRSFKELCRGLQPWEVARYFAASLELANSGSVTLTTSGEAEAGMDTLCLSLSSPTQNTQKVNESAAASHRRKKGTPRRDVAVNQKRWILAHFCPPQNAAHRTIVKTVVCCKPWRRTKRWFLICTTNSRQHCTSSRPRRSTTS